MSATNKTKKLTSISILGSGMVGVTVGKGFLELGNNVIFYDIDRKKVDELDSFGFNATDDIELAVLGSQVSFICVPTPTIRRKIDLSYVKSVVEKIEKSLEKSFTKHEAKIQSQLEGDDAF